MQCVSWISGTVESSVMIESSKVCLGVTAVWICQYRHDGRVNTAVQLKKKDVLQYFLL